MSSERDTGEGTAQHGTPERGGSDATMSTDMVVLGGSARTKEEAITEAGQLLVDTGAVTPAYVDAMHERERSVSTYMGNGLAIPHGTNDAKASINRTAISLVRYDEPVDWSGNPAKFVVGIAGVGDEHLTMLGNIAQVFVDQDRVAELEAAGSKEEVIRLLG